MGLTPDRERLKTLLVETITLLCKNGLNFQSEFAVEALIGITLDQNDVFLISIKETVRSTQIRDQNEVQGASLAESTAEQFVNHSISQDNQSADYQQTLSRQNTLSDSLVTLGSENNHGKGIGSKRRNKTNSAVKNYATSVSPSNDVCLADLPVALSSPGADACSSKNVTSKGVPHKNSSIHDGTLFTDQEPPHKKQRSISPLQKIGESGNDSRDTNIEDFIMQCKSEPIDVIKLEESPAEDSVASTSDRQEHSGFLYNAAYDGELGQRLDSSYTNWYSQENLVNSGAVPGCSSWPNDSASTQTKHLQDQVVELVPGSEVYISAALFHDIQQEQNMKGSRLVRRLIYDIFPDEQLLAMSSCLGKGHQSSRQGLDQNKVDAIKAFVNYKCPTMKERDIVQTINWICGNTRKRLRDRVKRLSQGYYS